MRTALCAILLPFLASCASTVRIVDPIRVEAVKLDPAAVNGPVTVGASRSVGKPDVVLVIDIISGNVMRWSKPNGRSLEDLLSDGYRVVSMTSNAGQANCGECFVIALHHD